MPFHSPVKHGRQAWRRLTRWLLRQPAWIYVALAFGGLAAALAAALIRAG